MLQYIRKIILILSILVTSYNDAEAQSQKVIDSLRLQLKKHNAIKIKLGKTAPVLFDTSAVNILYELSVAYWYGNPDTAIDLAKESMAISEKIGYKKGIGFALYSIGVSYVWKPELTLALEYTTKALEIGHALNNQKLIASAYLNLGMVYDEKSNYLEAIAQYSSALKMAELAGENQIASWCCNNLGVVYNKFENYDLALANYSKGLKFAKLIGDLDQQGTFYLNMANTTQSLEKPNKALIYANQALAIYEKLKDNYYIAACYSTLGWCFMKQGNLNQATNYYLKCIEIANKYNYKNLIGRPYRNFGELNLLQKDYIVAAVYFKKALIIAKEMGDLHLLNEANFNLKNTYLLLAKSTTNSIQKSKYSSEAARYHEQTLLYEDSIRYHDNLKKITQLGMQNEFEKKELKMQAEADKKQALSKLEIKQQILLRNISLASILSLLLFGGTAFYNYKKRKQLEATQALLNERMNISRNLHDELGSNLSSISMQSSLAKRKLNRQEDVKDIVDHISTASQDMVSKMSDIVWSMQIENENTTQLIERITNYCAVTLPNHEIEFDVQHNLDKTQFVVKAEILKELYFIIKESINNSLKHANCKLIKVIFNKVDNHLNIRVSDDGQGFDLTKHNRTTGGFGLKNMKHRAEKIGAEYHIQSSRDNGTVIQLNISLS